MHNKVIKEICENVKGTIDSYKDNLVMFSDKRYNVIPLSNEHFHQLREHYSPIRIGFIDGGNAEIMSSPNFCVSFIRVYYCIFEKNKKIKTKRVSFYCLTNSVVENEKILYRSKIFPFDGTIEIDEKLINFDSFDSTLRTGIHRAEMSHVGSAIRRFAELTMAKELVNELRVGDIVVLDGTLQSSFTHESKFLEDLYKTGLEKEVLITSIAKTCRLFTDCGNSLISALSKIAPAGSWYYYPLVEIDHPDHRAELFIAKLHDMSDYIFRIELLKEQKATVDVEKVLGVIAKNSVDPVFLGYPYGLIDADKFAQISQDEKKLVQIRFKANFSSKEIASYLNSLNAHDVLNRL